MKPYLNVVDDTLVAEFPPCAIPRCGKGIGSDVQERAIARIRNVDRRNGDCSRSAAHTNRTDQGVSAYTASGRAERAARSRPLCC